MKLLNSARYEQLEKAEKELKLLGYDWVGVNWLRPYKTPEIKKVAPLKTTNPVRPLVSKQTKPDEQKRVVRDNLVDDFYIPNFLPSHVYEPVKPFVGLGGAFAGAGASGSWEDSPRCGGESTSDSSSSSSSDSCSSGSSSND